MARKKSKFSSNSTSSGSFPKDWVAQRSPQSVEYMRPEKSSYDLSVEREYQNRDAMSPFANDPARYVANRAQYSGGATIIAKKALKGREIPD